MGGKFKIQNSKFKIPRLVVSSADAAGVRRGEF